VKNEGGQKWYQSIGLALTNHYAIVLRIFIEASVHILHKTFQWFNNSTIPNCWIIPNSGDFLASVIENDVDVKTPSGSLGGLYLSQLRWAQEICKLPVKSTKASSPGLGRVGLSM